MRCKICDSTAVELLYEQKGLPTLANKVYASLGEARTVPTFDVVLYFCHSCGFIFNGIFDETKINYDAGYDSDQTCSPIFQQHMTRVADLLARKGFKNGKVVEIGCGKGYFLKLLRQRGFEVRGFDPAFEDDDEDIIKDYFSSKYSAGFDADLIILRHVLEHIDSPAAFLRQVAEANQYKGSFYVEVPAFEWSVTNMAFWDIAPEHCNYFTQDAWSSLFSSYENELIFAGQYQYVVAELKSLQPGTRAELLRREKPVRFDLGKMTALLLYYWDFVRERPGILVWGAGGKGSTFVNLVDPQREFIPAVIDINPRKQGKYIGGVGHRVIGQDDLSKYNIRDVLIMNGNYKDEIRAILNDDRINLFVLGEGRFKSAGQSGARK